MMENKHTPLFFCHHSTSGRIAAILTPIIRSPRPSLVLPNSATERKYRGTGWRITLFFLA